MTLTVEELEDINLRLRVYYHKVLTPGFRNLSSPMQIALVPDKPRHVRIYSDVINRIMGFGGSEHLPHEEYLSSLWEMLTMILSAVDMTVIDPLSIPLNHTLTEVIRDVSRDLHYGKSPEFESEYIASVRSVLTNQTALKFTKARYDHRERAFHIVYGDGDYFIYSDDPGLPTHMYSMEVTIAESIASLANTVRLPPSEVGNGLWFTMGETSPMKQLLRDILQDEYKVLLGMRNITRPAPYAPTLERIIH